VSRHRRFQQPLRDQIGGNGGRGRGVRVVLDRETEVPGDTAARKLDDVFARTEELDDAEGEIGEANRIGGLRRHEKLVQGSCVGCPWAASRRAPRQAR